MLPCQTSCPRYCPGCHKTCGEWKQYQADQQTRRAAKKAYLQYHVRRCTQITRQFQSMQVRRLAW